MRTTLLVALCVAGLACVTQAVSMPSPLLALGEANETRAAIFEGMAVRGWAVESEEPSLVLARLERRDAEARVWIRYDSSQITFQYAGSENLRCRPAGGTCRSIHHNYNRWVANLAADISRASTQRRARQPLPAL